MNKKKIFNDPVYGFITIPSELIFDIIEHPFFQRLRRIKQLGLTDLVYPGALHTRFHHALGAMHLMSVALDNLRGKGHEISDQEYQAAQLAILLHDVGHGPFSHALEYSLLPGIQHEKLSTILMDYFNTTFDNQLELAIKIFNNQYGRVFFHDLISSQLDVDRLDYLKRDSFFTGVSEGTVGVNRILKMLEIRDGHIVVEEKAIYSIENFLNARRLMYWQVYLHKTTVSAEKMIIQIIKRAKDLQSPEVYRYASPALKPFLEHDITFDDFCGNQDVLNAFGTLDDYDIWGAIKSWSANSDTVLSTLSHMLLERRLFKVVLSNTPPDGETLERLKRKIQAQYRIGDEEVKYFLIHGTMSNAGYLAGGPNINILMKDGEIVDVAKASDLPNIKAMSKIVRKYYLCFPKDVYL